MQNTKVSADSSSIDERENSCEQHEFSYDPRFYFPHFQPIIDISSGRITGYEALTRTLDREGTVVSAGALYEDDSVPASARLNLDRSVRLKALQRFANDQSAGFIFINISPRWVGVSDENKKIATLSMIRETGISPDRVVVEITEKFGDLVKLEKIVRQYKDIGVKIAIDDFGVGGSQVDRLIALNPDFVKVDMGIFKDASKKGTSSNVLLSLSALSEKSNFEIICEGVESDEEFHFAIECGAQKVQGWLFAKADASLLSANSTRKSVATLQTQYLQRKSEMIVSASKRNRLISKYMRSIFVACSSNEKESINAKDMCRVGILRFYVCDIHGRQITPSYNFLEDKMSMDEGFIDHYWSHRPYFPVAVGLKGRTKRSQIVSSSYVDALTKKLCKTTIMYLSDGTILLVDSTASDDVLYCLP